ncbi:MULTISPECIES: nucleotide exchange factor GrpE [Dietzia]|uniref:nucleotide exchange factor GrpE n=1 Tax=Dietzia TaxID=37914 RepID=UPI0007C6B2FC|nr:MULTISPECIES: nucleotide exchange factor GrpE [Dietzia]AVM63659.1 nucleotide exchange factor GrpE [Dietzia sp. oral taxon 368]MCT2063338.1 nucleotide exchange factor GrpE [Dietzia cinnamea]MCT2235274.1 nucleotide exchange factor GrpE [Dietzia cinnamea]MCT2300346.1 nucleotide exchange factor GrpE [Dietzia cinnamea]OAH43701.1 molecular chaperone [Dietzia cinnamea]
MTRPEESDAAETAAWAGADDETQRAAETVEAEVVDEGTAPADGPAAADDTAADGTATEADGDRADDGGDDDPTSALQAQLDERTADLQRVSAEFANYRRRVERDRQSIIDTAKGSVLTELLTIVDDLDRAREHGDLEEGPLKVFADKVHALLASQGVEAFGEEGDAFDPAIHEAVQDESDGSEPVLGTILRKGYRHGERTLRTAMVIVR